MISEAFRAEAFGIFPFACKYLYFFMILPKKVKICGFPLLFSVFVWGLTNWKQERGRLIGACWDGQDTFRELLRMLDIPEPESGCR